MSGLLRGIARTAIISGTATAVSNNVSRRQAGRWAEQRQRQDYEQRPVQPAYVAPAPPPAPAPAPATPSGGTGVQDRIDQLKELAQLKEAGILTDAEFDAQKALILGS